MANENPPVRGIPQAFYNSVGTATRNQDGTLSIGGNTYYAFYGDTLWVLDKTANQTNAPAARFTQFAFDAIQGGTYNSGSLTVTYATKNYQFKIIQDPANAEKNLIDASQV